MFKVKFADIGEGLTEGSVTEIFVKVGDKVKSGDSLFNVETDKVNSDIYAQVDGIINKIFIKEGQEIKVGDVVIEINDGSASSEVSSQKEEPTKAIVEENKKVEVVSQSSNVESSNIEAENIQSYDNKLIKATPLARKMAADLKINLANVVPTGPNQRILAIDIQNYQANPTSLNAVSNIQPTKQVTKQVVDFSNPLIQVPEFNEPLSFNSTPMNPIRKATVKAMDVAHTKAAGFTGLKNVDITELVNLRNQLKGFAETQKVKLTYLAFIIKATALSLKDMPNLNVRIDEENKAIKFANQINIGMACDTPDGLMVPVIKSADKLSVLQIAVKINDLATKARNKKLAMSEMSGGTFTVTNFGSVGLDYATPIVNYPESAILGIGTITKAPGVINDQIEIRDFMPFSLTADHKVIDGADAGRFLQRVVYYLQNPAILLV
ncbi:pyruvate dehydrogenase E2 component [Spiroplasma gladiatoris]|uniref:Dihydrolipoamide acetyltransferase component of pyruvate dehydrogenase complex n=1 Tax=Spiroplasma gladiatoris TaxID=2143 RepID=A0A4P7AH41_9MOLU|nr:dihydrolipoamide acetyltransferase family protein [Spiroplasma gladiatoris]QBQ07754.1 pyruvate dehydrogenase E2 component [Spiroplasma gladiatoris]